MYRSSVYYFGALLLLAMPAFWQTYFFPPKYETDWHVHLHGLAMFTWVVLMIVQASLIRARQKIDVDVLYFLYVQLSLIAVLAASWALAMINRRRPHLHMRYMVCVALSLVDPIVARILFFHGGIDFPATQVVTYGLVDAILVALALNDRARHQDIHVYPRMLAVFVTVQMPTFFLYKLPAWRELAEGYAALPLP